jgi:hypothetical protein
MTNVITTHPPTNPPTYLLQPTYLPTYPPTHLPIYVLHSLVVMYQNRHVKYSEEEGGIIFQKKIIWNFFIKFLKIYREQVLYSWLLIIWQLSILGHIVNFFLNVLDTINRTIYHY